MEGLALIPFGGLFLLIWHMWGKIRRGQVAEECQRVFKFEPAEELTDFQLSIIRSRIMTKRRGVDREIDRRMQRTRGDSISHEEWDALEFDLECAECDLSSVVSSATRVCKYFCKDCKQTVAELEQLAWPERHRDRMASFAR